jgi:hypothetical protein
VIIIGNDHDAAQSTRYPAIWPPPAVCLPERRLSPGVTHQGGPGRRAFAALAQAAWMLADTLFRRSWAGLRASAKLASIADGQGGELTVQPRFCSGRDGAQRRRLVGIAAPGSWRADLQESRFRNFTGDPSMSQRIPQAMAEKFAAVTALTDAFCEHALNDEYRQLIHRLVGTLARKRPSPLLRGTEKVWAAAAVHAVGRINFLDDPAQTPHCRPSAIFQFFGVAESTGQNKSREIREMLKMGSLSPDWTLPSRLARNPLVWMLNIDGVLVDIRHAPIELQRLAFAKGLIPFIPAEQMEPTA